jgi:hypothetical protein
MILTEIGNLDTMKSDDLRKTIKRIWVILFKSADVNGDGTVSCDEFLAHIKEVLFLFR